MLIDTHCHLDFAQFDADREQVINRAKQQGIEFMINVAADLNGAEKSLELSAKYEFIFATAGIHPHYVMDVRTSELISIENFLENEKIVALGEVGLDYYNHTNPQLSIDRTIKNKQQEILDAFIDMAKRKNLPLVLHCRQAHDDMLAILQNHHPGRLKAVVHCFSGSQEFLKNCLDMGLKISFTANITYKKAEDLRRLVAYVPLQEMFLETDAPYLAPQAQRGKRNEPSYVRYVAQEVAKIKNLDAARLAEITTRSARLFFNI